MQEKVCNYISEKYFQYKLLHEYDCDLIPINPKIKAKLPYDNELHIGDNAKLIVESHGIQYSQVCGLHVMSARKSKITPEQEFHYQQVKDCYKKLFALSKGYFYLAVSHEDETDDRYKTMIDNKIAEILNNSANKLN